MFLKLNNNPKLKVFNVVQLEYLESSGTQYIDTGIIAKVTDNFEIEYQFINGSGEQSVFGIHGDALANMIMYTGWWWGGTNRYNYSQGTTKHILTKNNNLWTLDGTQLSYSINSGNIPTGNWSLFTAKSGTNYTAYAATVKIYRFKLYRAGLLLIDLIPALDNNNIPCMYDIVSDTYFYNQGTVDFIAGPEIGSITTNIAESVDKLFIKNCPLLNGYPNLKKIYNVQSDNGSVVLSRVRVDVGNVSGSITELMQYASMAGFNDAGEEQAKPRLVGTWTINDWYTQEQLAQAQAAFDGLTIVPDPNYLINFNDLAVQVLDSTKPNYNPAVAIILQKAGYGKTFDTPPYSGQSGRWMITKARMNEGLMGPYFKFSPTVIDENGIVGEIGLSYDLVTFNEFKYFGNSHRFHYGGTGAWSSYILSGNNKLIEVTMPDNYNLTESANVSGQGIFSTCTSLKTVHNLENINPDCFNISRYALDLKHFFRCSSLEHLDLPAGITQIYLGTFEGCTNLVINTLPSTLTTIGEHAFSGCTKLNITSIPAGVTSIPYMAFNNTGIITLTLHSNINTIGQKAFASCQQFTTLHMLSEVPPTISTNTFSSSNNLTIYVGDGTSASHDDAILQAYLADTNWATYSSRLDTWYNYLHPTT